MAKYILLVNWTDQGVRNVKDSPKRLDAARKLAETAGARMGDFYMTMGGYDMVAHLEAPDDATVAKFVLSLAAGGNVRTQTLKAFSEDEYRKILAAA
ncbi:MAG TPA: GYD domain-containing protein [Dongiaceae bacterium]